MCTAISYCTKDHYFGRNLDLEYNYSESVTVTPRRFPFLFRGGRQMDNHYALIGMSTVVDGYPLYYDATNEKGLSMAALNFPKLAVYRQEDRSRENIAPFELIPWILCQYATVTQALTALETLNLWNHPYSEKFPVSPLHWLLSDRECSITIEPLAEGLKIYENPVGVLTNNPPFDFHMYNLANYMNLTNQPPVNRFSHQLTLQPYSQGMGGIGLPGDLSSASRFVKAAFTKLNSVSGSSESESISQFFHILGSVAQQRGLSCVRDAEYEYTLYSSCCNASRGIYYYTTYENSQITAVDMYKESLDGNRLVSYPLITGQQVHMQNG